MNTEPELLTALVRQANLCTDVVEQIHMDLQDPGTPDKRADILIATEHLAEAVVGLLAEVRAMAWQSAGTAE